MLKHIQNWFNQAKSASAVIVALLSVSLVIIFTTAMLKNYDSMELHWGDEGAGVRIEKHVEWEQEALPASQD